MSEAKVRGKVVTAALNSVKPNGWNPNVVTPEKMASIEYGFKTDGWLASQALLVWRKDDKGKVQNVIVDGEHRWKAARNVGLVEGPMVFLDGIAEAEAKALTIKLNQKRGVWDTDALGVLLREIQGASADIALEFGFDTIELDALLNDVAREAPVLEQHGQPERGGIDTGAKSARAPGAPVELTEAQVAADIGAKKLRLVVVCEDRVYAQRVADLLSANSIAFEERFE